VTVAIVPIKSLTHAKSRLAPYLTAAERQELVVQLLRHTVDVLRGVQTLEQIAVVSPTFMGWKTMSCSYRTPVV
jgi:2-phospho-L-lactate guanylyltransferase (CobY/MobA/RfbA family)